jgi:hypothetical protein
VAEMKEETEMVLFFNPMSMLNISIMEGSQTLTWNNV